MPAAISIIIMTMTETASQTPPPPAGGGWGEGAMPVPLRPPPPHPLPQGEREDRGFHPPSIPLLRLLAWLSPAFPTGAFAYSHGLEWAVEAGDVIDETTLHAWLADVLADGSGRNDAILLRHAYRPGIDLGSLNDLAIAIAP